MTTVTEGSLRITFPPGSRVRKFDDHRTHGMSHCMKAVDLIVDEDDRTLFIEIKDPEQPNATDEDRVRFIEKFQDGKLDKDLVYKYRDSFIYEWACENTAKPIHYWAIIAIDGLSDADLLTRTDALKRKLPVQDCVPSTWKRPIVAGCMVFNLRTWNRLFETIPISRFAG